MTERAAGTGAEQDRVAELEQRIRAMADLGDASLGRFTRWDWWACIVGACVAPIVALWWFAP